MYKREITNPRTLYIIDSCNSNLLFRRLPITDRRRPVRAATSIVIGLIEL